MGKGKYSSSIEPESVEIAFQACRNILSKWDCTPAEKQVILGSGDIEHWKPGWSLSMPTDSVDELLERMSLILNIHAKLRLIFSNPDNVYGFMRMANGNRFFDGRRPIEVIATGSISDLWETWRQIDGILPGLPMYTAGQ